MPDLDRSEAKTHFVMLGGFLGSGKTTALLRLARRYTEAGLRVGIITNDFGEELVDTATFRSAGFPAEEIPRGCFCRRFDELLAAAGRLQDGSHPDVLLAEPAGSGTNLVHTVIRPLEDVYADRFRVAPYVALLDPQRALTALGGTGRGGFSAKVLYLYKMQQTEADVVAINKIDTLGPAELEEVTSLVARNFPKAEVLPVSARTGEGFEHLAAVLDGGAPVGVNALDLAESDQSTVADANDRLSWLNAAWKVTATSGFGADELLVDLADALRGSLAGVSAEPGHVKMILRSGDDLAIANLLSSARPPELSRPCGARMTDATLIVNARVEVAPSILRKRVEAAVRSISAQHGAKVTPESITATAPKVS